MGVSLPATTPRCAKSGRAQAGVPIQCATTKTGFVATSRRTLASLSRRSVQSARTLANAERMRRASMAFVGRWQRWERIAATAASVTTCSNATVPAAAALRARRCRLHGAEAAVRSGSICQAMRSLVRYLGGTSPGDWAQMPIAIVFRIQVSFDLQSERAAQRPLRSAQWPEPTLVRLSQRTSSHFIPSGHGFAPPGEPHSAHVSPGFSGGAISGGGNF
jgi:hypothetical protein